MATYQSTNVIGRHRLENRMAKRICITINVVKYYDAMPDDPQVRSRLGDNPNVGQLAELDQELFRQGELDWDDLFDREDVEFVGVET